VEFNTDDEERDLVSRHPHSSRNFLCSVMEGVDIAFLKAKKLFLNLSGKIFSVYASNAVQNCTLLVKLIHKSGTYTKYFSSVDNRR